MTQVIPVIPVNQVIPVIPGSQVIPVIPLSQEETAGNMIYYVNIGGKKVLSVKNSRPSEFENVKVFASSSWYSPVNGFIKNLVIENKNRGS